MKKILMLLVVVSLLVGVVGFVGANVTQTASVEVISDLSLIVNPNPIDYGTLKPGSKSIKNVTLTPGTSHLHIAVAITGSSLLDDIQWDRNNDTVYEAYNAASFNMTAETAETFNTKINVPVGESAASHSATITYTVLEKP